MLLKNSNARDASMQATASSLARTSHMHEDSLLSVQDVHVELGGNEILKGIDLRVDPGEFLGLIGSNGAGKTTLLRTILGDVEPSRGYVSIEGRRHAKAGMIGYVPQKIQLDPDLPIRAKDLVALGLDGQRFGIGMRGARFWNQVEHAMTGVGAWQFADRPVGRLSGGQQQRVLIAAALVASPKLMLLDEPLANLDPANADDIVKLLNDIRKNEGISIILSAHDINPLIDSLDKVVYLASGNAVVGTTDEVITTEVLSALYRHPIEVLHAGGRVMVMAGETSHAHVNDVDPFAAKPVED
ncbi:metal ABC transporter ATP-binding protein [Bifidobacterium aquikefiricola]|uniref:Metal ABC transporter ATP-binding protein n=1 Tax=Bifidobacterium aquikefiricola TaxID=3059038 RepID=A0AB39U4H4_9BIFI